MLKEEFSQEELDAIKVLAENNKIIYVNKQSYGLGRLYMDGKRLYPLTSIEIKSDMSDGKVRFTQVKVGIVPVQLGLEEV